MAIRRYDNYSIKDAAATIVAECIRDGKSDGWCGNNPEFDAVEKICNQYNVFYVNDYFGRWEHREVK